MHLNNFLKRKFSINKKSKAQHVVELAMMMPLFIILFSYTFQLMVETYSKYKFSYIFTNSVRNVINSQVIYQNIANVADYNITNIIQDKLRNEITQNGTNKIPFTDVYVEAVNSDETIFFRGAYQLKADSLFFGQTGTEYFYFTIPVNRTYTAPIVLNKTTYDVESYFNFYFKYYSEKYYEADDGSEGTTEGDGTEGGTEGGDGTEGGTDGGDGTEGGTDGGDGTGGGEDSGTTGSLEDGSGGDAGDGAIPAALGA